MRRGAVVWLPGLVVLAGLSCGDGSGGYGSSCPTGPSLSTCPAAPGGHCVAGRPDIGCALDAVPAGLPCSGHTQCALGVLPCPGEVESWAGGGRVDGYICSCINDRWSCDDCWLGEALCADGADGASLLPTPMDAAFDTQDSTGEGARDDGGAFIGPDASGYVSNGDGAAGCPSGYTCTSVQGTPSCAMADASFWGCAHDSDCTLLPSSYCMLIGQAGTCINPCTLPTQ